MKRTFAVTITLAAALSSSACKVRVTEDQVAQGPQGPTSPAESGQQGPEAFNRSPYMHSEQKADTEHETAGLMPEYNNGKTDPTMEGSGNIAWQGDYEREKRAANAAQAQPLRRLDKGRRLAAIEGRKKSSEIPVSAGPFISSPRERGGVDHERHRRAIGNRLAADPIAADYSGLCAPPCRAYASLPAKHVGATVSRS